MSYSPQEAHICVKTIRDYHLSLERASRRQLLHCPTNHRPDEGPVTKWNDHAEQGDRNNTICTISNDDSLAGCIYRLLARSFYADDFAYDNKTGDVLVASNSDNNVSKSTLYN